MSHRALPEPRDLWRIGDANGAFPVWGPIGAMTYPGRWNIAGDAVIYAAEHYSLAMLEKLAHFTGDFPRNQCFVKATIPAGVTYEVFQPAANRGWDASNPSVAQDFGSKWVREKRSAILLVPSVIAQMENNIVINTTHPDAVRIVPGLEQPVWWDDRLLSR